MGSSAVLCVSFMVFSMFVQLLSKMSCTGLSGVETEVCTENYEGV